MAEATPATVAPYNPEPNTSGQSVGWSKANEAVDDRLDTGEDIGYDDSLPVSDDPIVAEAFARRNGETDEPLDQEMVEQETRPDLIKLKVNGKIIETTQEGVIELAQKYAASEKRLEEAKGVERQAHERLAAVDELIHTMRRASPAQASALMREVGIDFDKLAIERAVELFDYENMPPEQRRAIELEQRERAFEMEQRRLQEQQQQAQAAQLTKQHAVALEQAVPPALEEVGLPKSKYVLDRMTVIWKEAVDRKMISEPRSLDEYHRQARNVARYVKAEMQQHGMLNIAAMPADKLAETLGPRLQEVIQTINKARPQPVARRENIRRPAQQPKSGYIRASDWKI